MIILLDEWIQQINYPYSVYDASVENNFCNFDSTFDSGSLGFKFWILKKLGCITIIQYILWLFSSSANEVGNFTITGTLLLPSSGDYQDLPGDTCLHLTVQDFIFCEFCEIPVRGKITMRDISVDNNRILFQVPCSCGNGFYGIS